jgi:hypothetical protein
MHQEFVDLVNDDKHYYHRAFYWGDFMRREKLLLLFPFCLISCATPQAPVPADYQSYNCSQLGAELQLVNSKISDGENQQVENKIVGGTMSMLGYSVASGPGDGADLPSLKARQDALQHLMIARDCYAAQG